MCPRPLALETLACRRRSPPPPPRLSLVAPCMLRSQYHGHAAAEKSSWYPWGCSTGAAGRGLLPAGGGVPPAPAFRETLSWQGAHPSPCQLPAPQPSATSATVMLLLRIGLGMPGVRSHDLHRPRDVRGQLHAPSMAPRGDHSGMALGLVPSARREQPANTSQSMHFGRPFQLLRWCTSCRTALASRTQPAALMGDVRGGCGKDLALLPPLAHCTARLGMATGCSGCWGMPRRHRTAWLPGRRSRAARRRCPPVSDAESAAARTRPALGPAASCRRGAGFEWRP
jgi:hypothetical protein